MHEHGSYAHKCSRPPDAGMQAGRPCGPPQSGAVKAGAAGRGPAECGGRGGGGGGGGGANPGGDQRAQHSLEQLKRRLQLFALPRLLRVAQEAEWEGEGREVAGQGRPNGLLSAAQPAAVWRRHCERGHGLR